MQHLAGAGKEAVVALEPIVMSERRSSRKASRERTPSISRAVTGLLLRILMGGLPRDGEEHKRGGSESERRQPEARVSWEPARGDLGPTELE